MPLKFRIYDSYTYNTPCFGGFVRERKGEVGPCGPVCPAGPASLPGADACRGTCGILQLDCHHDDRPVHRGRRNLPDGTGQDDRRSGHQAGGNQRDQALPSRHAGHGLHRSLRQQHRHGGPHAPYRGEYGSPCRHFIPPSSHASGLCQQHGRYDDPHRYSSEPHHPGDPFDSQGKRSCGCLRSGYFILHLPSGGSDHPCCGHPRSHASDKVVPHSEREGKGQEEEQQVAQGACQGIWSYGQSVQGSCQGFRFSGCRQDYRGSGHTQEIWNQCDGASPQCRQQQVRAHGQPAAGLAFADAPAG